ncbi:MAG: hypothetical protein U5M50_10465 [Sphingobium sp.]|nr:hypothetical protein [Sphingobium sp.]
MSQDIAQLRKLAFAGDAAQVVPVTRRALREIVRRLDAAQRGGTPA